MTLKINNQQRVKLCVRGGGGKRGRSEKDETTGVRKTKPRTRPTREAASKPKTYAVDSDSLDEEEEEDDAFVGVCGGGGIDKPLVIELL